MVHGLSARPSPSLRPNPLPDSRFRAIPEACGRLPEPLSRAAQRALASARPPSIEQQVPVIQPASSPSR